MRNRYREFQFNEQQQMFSQDDVNGLKEKFHESQSHDSLTIYIFRRYSNVRLKEGEKECSKIRFICRSVPLIYFHFLSTSNLLVLGERCVLHLLSMEDEK